MDRGEIKVFPVQAERIRLYGGKPLELSAQEGSEDKTASADSVLQAFDAKGKLFLCPVVDEGSLDNLPLPVDEAQAVVHHLAADEGCKKLAHDLAFGKLAKNRLHPVRGLDAGG